MLKFLAVAAAFRRRRPADVEKALEKDEEPEVPQPDTGTLTDNYDDDDDDELEEDHDDDLEHEHDTDDIIAGMEAESVGERPQGVPMRRGRTYTSSLSFLLDNKRSPPEWYLKFKDYINPKTTHQDMESYVPNYRYTPILSGIVIPFSILLEIPGLTEHWYVRTINNQIVERRNNPAILNIGLGFSMACALVANICLVVRFLEKKVKLMTIGCIVFLTIHDLINIIAVTIFGVEHRFNDGFTYGQSFWMTVCSTAVSTFTNLTLITDLLRTPDFENSGSGLTRRQRSLAVVVILLLCYIAFGALIHSIILELNFIDAMYFTLVSIETIGFGDIQPHGTGARLFTCIYAVFGIVTIALAVGMMRETVLEGLEVGYRKRVQEVRQRRKIGRWRRRVMNRWREAVEWRLREAGYPIWVRDKRDGKKVRGIFSEIRDCVNSLLPWPTGEKNDSGFRMGSHQPHGMHLNLEALSWKQLEAAAMEAGVPLNTLLPEGFRERREESDASSRDGSIDILPALDPERKPPEPDVPLTHARLGRMIAMIGAFALAVDKSSHLCGEAPPVPARLDVSAAQPQIKKSLTLQYDAFRSGMAKEEAKAFYARLTVAWILFIMFWLIGSAIFMVTEGWPFGISLYFCFIAFTTIGYGDYSPQTPAGRSIFVVWALLGVATMTILISVISEAFSSQYHTALHMGVFDRAVKRYRERARALAEKTRRGKNKLLTPSSRPQLAENQTKDDLLKEVHSRTQDQLEALPHKILADAKMFHEHLSYFVGDAKRPAVDSGEALPQGLQQLMNEITGAEKIGERIKREILQDEDARHTLFTLSIEQALRKMINSAEAALHALEERENLMRLHNQPEGGASISSSPDSEVPAVVELTRVPEHDGSSTPVTFEAQAPRVRGIKYSRWDTTTSSEFSDWR